MTLKTISLSVSILLLTACSSQKINKENIESNITTTQIDSNIVSEPILTQDTIVQEPVTVNPTQDISYGISGDFAGNYKLQDFIQRMVVEHGFDESTLNQLFSQAKNTKMMPTPVYERRRGRNTSTLRTGKWDRYKNMFVYENNIQRGLAFWEEHKDTLNRAYEVYGVLPEYIMGIIGIETAYGVNFGKKRVIDVLTTKSMTGDRRENFYTKQLEKFLIMTKQANLQPAELMGSDAGAMGYGQFIASSYLDFAVDFNGDGVTDLWNAEDAIGSIANYFARNGWNRSLKTVAVRAKYRGNRFRRLKTGYKTKYSQYTLRKRHHITPRQRLHFNGAVSLIKLPRYAHDELWMGTHNFRVITTYNHSELYGMAVYHLAQAVRKRRYGH
jgi:membrane-bound lytic murein transglycosylase B